MERDFIYKLTIAAAMAVGAYEVSSSLSNLTEIRASGFNNQMMVPGAVETQIASVAKNADWEALIKENKVAKLAVKSSIQLQFGRNLGSGNLAIINGNIVIFTAGHALDNSEGENLTINRIGLPNGFGNLDLGRQTNYTYVYNNQEGGDLQDFGIVVVTQPEVVNLIEEVTTPDQFLTINDLNFAKLKKGSKIDGLCYPAASTPMPYPLIGGVTIGESATSSQFIVDGFLTYPKCSGGGLFSANKYTGAVSMGFPPITPSNMGIPSFMVDDAYITTLNSIGGRAGFENLLQIALNK
jgi:hypothetical protein